MYDTYCTRARICIRDTFDDLALEISLRVVELGGTEIGPEIARRRNRPSSARSRSDSGGGRCTSMRISSRTTRTSARGPFTRVARFGELINWSPSTWWISPPPSPRGSRGHKRRGTEREGSGGRGGNFVRTKPHRDETTPRVRSSPRLNLFTIGPFNELHFGTWTCLGASTRESPRNHAGWSASREARGVRDSLTRIEFTSYSSPSLARAHGK